MALRREKKSRGVNSFLAGLFRKAGSDGRLSRRETADNSKGTIRRRKHGASVVEILEVRALLSSTNIGAVRPNFLEPNDLMQYLLDTDPLGGPRDSAQEIDFYFGFSATSVGGSGVNDVTLAGDFSGVGFDQAVVTRATAGALQWLGDTDRDTTQEYLFRFGLAGFKPLIADMNNDGYDDAIAVDMDTTSNLLEWYVHYGVAGASPFPTDDSTVSVDATFSFGVDSDHPAAVAGVDDIPVVGDFNGDGLFDIGVARNDGTLFDWYIHNVSGAYPNNTATVLSVSTTINNYGANNDVPVVGDWDNDGDENIGVVDEDTSPSTWNLDTNGGGSAEISLQYGLAGDQYVVGTWADRVWDGGAATINWSDAANWDSNILPTVGDDVLIGELAGAPAIAVTATMTIQSLTTRERLNFQLGTITIEESSEFPLGLDVSGATLSSNATLTSQLTTSWSAGQIGRVGTTTTFVNDGAMTFSGASSRNLQTATFVNSGTFTQTAGQLVINTSTFMNTVANTYNLQGALSNPAFTTLTGSFVNDGLFADSMTGTHGVSGTFSNNGTVSITAGTFQFPGGNTHTGTFSVSGAATTLQIASGTNNYNAGTAFNGAGTVQFLSGAHNINTNVTISKLVNSATISIGVGKTLTATSPTLSSGTVTGLGTLVVSGTTTIGVTATISGNVMNSGTLNVTNSAQVLLNSPGVLTNSNGATLAFTTSANPGITGLGQLDNFGLITTTGTVSISVNNYNNKSGGEIRALSGSLALPSTGTHAGTFTAMPGATLSIQNGTMTLNTGTSFGGGGTVVLSGGTYNVMDNISGTNLQLSFGATYMNVDAGKTFTLAGNSTITGANFNSLITATGTIRNTGTLAVSGGVGIVRGTFSNADILYATAAASTFTLSPGAVLLNEATGRYDIQSSAGLQGPSGSFVNNGIFNHTTVSTSPINVPVSGSGTISVSAGVFDFQRSSTFSTSIFTATGATARFGNSFTFNFNSGVSFPGTGTVEFANGTFNVNTDVTAGNVNMSSSFGNIVVAASKTFTWTGISSISGGSFGGTGAMVNLGSIAIGATSLVNAIGISNLLSGTIDISSNLSMTGAGSLTNAGLLRRTTAAGTVTIANSLNNTGTVDVQTGTLTLNGAVAQSTTSTLTGGTWIVSGTLNFPGAAPNITTLGSSASVTLSGASADFSKFVTVNNIQGEFKLVNKTFLGSAGAGVVNSGSVTVDGGDYSQSSGQPYTQSSGTTQLLNGATFSATVTVNGGTVSGEGVFIGASFSNVSGTVSPGTSPGILQFTGDYVQGAAGVLNIELGGTSAVIPEFDQILINGSATLNGTLNVSLISGFLPDKTEDFRFMTFASRTGNFSTINLPQLNGRTLLATNPQATFYDLNGTTLIVRNTSDSGSFSLRDRITVGNSIPGPDVIFFASAGTIAPLTPLPQITQTLLIDGTSASGASGGPPAVELRGDLAGVGANGFYFGFGSSGSALTGFAINRFAGKSVYVENTSSVLIFNNYLGTNLAGTASGGTNGGDGVQFFQVTGSTIRDNVISGNVNGITVGGGSSSGNTIAGNKIGTNATGTAAIPNSAFGVWLVFGDSSTVGGLAVADRNIISGNANHGIRIESGANSHTIWGNYIGLNAAGNAAIGNVGSGISIVDSSSAIIGGTVAGARNIISGNNSRGIEITGASATGNFVQGNYIGTDVSGTLPRANTTGVYITSSGNTVGGPGARNLISGNTQAGIRITGTAATGNTVAGNYIGLNEAGTSALPNGSYGVVIVSGASNNTIGGSTASDRNVISGNGYSGIEVASANSNGNVIAGNYIGTNASGTQAVGNTVVGVGVGSPNTVVGGHTAIPGTGAGNVISGNGNYQVKVTEIDSAGTVILGNVIGLDKDGNAAITAGHLVELTQFATGVSVGGTTSTARNVISGANSGNAVGVLISGSASGNVVQGNYVGTNRDGTLARPNTYGVIVYGYGNTIGGTASGAGNLISGNTTGVRLNSTFSTGNVVAGNLIGTNPTGTAALANTTGVLIDGGAHDNVIGGTTAAARNVISGNSGDGVFITGATTTGNVLSGNYIGTDVTGNIGLANFLSGINLDGGTGTVIGGFTTTPGTAAGNVISGNSGRGILAGVGASGTQIRSNLIGLGADGVTDLGNGLSGVQVNGLNTLIGGDDDDDGALDGSVQSRNVISGNTTQGINIGHSGSVRNTIVRGNYVGTTRDGSAAVGNAVGGINAGSAPGTYIGGESAGAGNLISGNASSGISIGQISYPVIDGLYSVVVQGNTVGLNAAGTASLANALGISISNSHNLIGGTSVAARNVISGNASSGIVISGSGITSNVVSGNYIGLNAAGTTGFGNAADGVRIEAGAVGNTIGGSTTLARNVISGNTGDGIEINDADNNTVAGNYVGLNAAGTGRVANTGNGLLIVNTASGNRVGTDGDGVNDADERNVISGNASGTNANVNIFGSGTAGNVVAGNFIGTTANGLATVVNSGRGVRIAVSSTGNRIGTDGSNDAFNANERNIISGHSGIGVFVVGGSNNNVVAGNYVGLNAVGIAVLGNSVDGITLDNVSGVRIGTNADGIADSDEANVITGSGGWGMLVSNGSTLNTVAGNRIGTNAAGTATLPNGFGGLLMGANATFNTIGGTVAGSGNLISGNLGPGIAILRTYLSVTYPASPNNTIQGNLIGTDITGTLDLGNATDGILIEEPNTTIGGTTAGARNIISGNNSSGIRITGAFASNVNVLGNYIGTDVTGLLDLGNLSHGIQILTSASLNTIGGQGASDRNLISGNEGAGIFINSTSLNGTTVLGNFIGTNNPGTGVLGNSGSGIEIQSRFNTIGGAAAGARNIISGNAGDGVRIIGDNAGDNVVSGNYIGTDLSGNLTRGNLGNGVSVIQGSRNIIGGGLPGSGNLLSGNSTGVYLEHNNFVSNVANKVKGNIIGLNAAGNAARGNLVAGVYTYGNSPNTANVIGTDGDGVNDAGEGNVISGNNPWGVVLESSFNVVAGNLIGTDITGMEGIGNGSGSLHGGVRVRSSNNRIGTNANGTSDAFERNVIARGFEYGISIEADFTTVAGNYIGTDAAGAASLSNGVGIKLESNATDNIIGGAIGAARNVISGNSSYGILLNGADDNRVMGNFIGLDASGTAALPNIDGIFFSNSFNNIIGTDGSNDAFNAGERNYISGNSDRGIVLDGANEVAGNWIGLDVNGAALGNGYGIQITGTGSRVGTNADGIADSEERNVIASSTYNGIIMSSTAAVVAGNYIGTDPTGTQARPNQGRGIHINSGGNGNIIGGTLAAARNVISGNKQQGVIITDAATSNNTILGNYIGTDVSGTRPLPNSTGIEIQSNDNVIGGNSPQARNIIAANTVDGIRVLGSDNDILGNYIGTDFSGTAALGHGGHGVQLVGAGNTVVSGNVIANAVGAGLRLEGTTSSNGSYVNNVYFGNLGLAIDAGASGRTLNDAPDADGVLNYPLVTSTQIVGSELIVDGTMPVGTTVELYVSAPAGDGAGQGRLQLASVLDDSASDGNSTAGQFRVRIPLSTGVNHGTPLTALAIGSTSEFSPIVFAGEVGSSLAPQITLSATNVSVISGNSISVDGSFYDPDSLSWEGTVNYGDGSGTGVLTLNADNTFRLEHTYVATGSFPVTVQIRDTSLVTSTAIVQVTVQNEAPTATFNQFTITSPASEGQQVTLTGRFEDTAGIHTATIVWGDGDTSIVPVTFGAREFTATHVYVDDSNVAGTATPSDVYRVTVTITDNSGASDTTPVGLFLEEVRNVLPSSLNVTFGSTSITEGQSVSLTSLNFSDPGRQDIHTVKVNWGDGSDSRITLPTGARSLTDLTTLQLAQLLPHLTHTYADDPTIGPDEYTITVEVADDDEPQQAATLTRVISVANAVPSSVTASLTAPTIFENGTVSLQGYFVDGGQLDTHRVTVDWGDGSSGSSFSLAAGVFAFSGITHRYPDNAVGGASYQITVRVSDNDSPTLSGSATLAAQVLNVVPLVGSVDLSTGGAAINEGDSVTITGTWTDVSPVDSHIVLVNWGDGNSTPAIIDSTSRTFAASHLYKQNGPSPAEQFVVTVTVLDDDGGSSPAVIRHQTVRNVSPTVVISPSATNLNANLIALESIVTDPGIQDTFAYSWTAAPLGVPGYVPQTGNLPTFSVDRALHFNSLWRITLTVTDNDGGATTIETALRAGSNADDVIVIDNSTLAGTGLTKLLIVGLGGNDLINGSGVTSASVSQTLDGGTGQDFLFGGHGDDVFILRDGDDFANWREDLSSSGGGIATTLTVPKSLLQTIGFNDRGNDRFRLKPNSTLTVADTSGSNILDFGPADFGDLSGVRFDLDTANSTTLVRQDVSLTQPAAHYVRTLGTFSELVGSRFGDQLTGATDGTVSGGAGDDQLSIKANTTNATFFGGADDDILNIPTSTVGISDLSFGGDNGLDVLINLSSIAGLTFSGGADDDILQNVGTITGLDFGGGADDDILQNMGIVLGQLTFGGDEGVDALLNTGDISSLIFNGGADDDIFVNNGSAETDLSFNGDDNILLSGPGSVGSLTFNGGADDDIFANLGDVTTITFSGGADDDIFLNNGTAASSLNFGGDLDVLLSGAGTIGDLTFGGDDGIDAMLNTGSIATLVFNGGADDDIFVNNGSAATDLSFNGDDNVLLSGPGSIDTLTFNGGADDDIFANLGDVISMTFNGGADDDIFLNNGTAASSLNFGGDLDVLLSGAGTIGDLTFGGDDGIDAMLNTGSITTLVFNGGADDDIFVNNGSATTDLSFNGDQEVWLEGAGDIGTLTFNGGADDDIFANLGSVESVTFNGGADDDLFINSGATVSTLNFGGDDNVLLAGVGTIGDLTFGGDAGLDTLMNFGSVTTLTFNGGADDDILQNIGTATTLTFNGGGDDDILTNTGVVLDDLNFGGDDGLDSLLNTGTVSSLTYGGGADDDIFINTGSVTDTLNFGGDGDILIDSMGAVSLVFGGDEGVDTLINSGLAGRIIFTGGADDDILRNTGTVIADLNFGGDEGLDLLVNTGTASSLTFGGGADGDILVNTGTVTGTLNFGGDGDILIDAMGVVSLSFGGDTGADILFNRGEVATLTFTGGADDDILFNSGAVSDLTFNGGADDDILQNNGSDIDSLYFGGGADDDLLINNGGSIASLIFSGGADDDILISNGDAIGVLEFTGDDGIPVPGRTSNDTLIVRGSGSESTTSRILFDGGYGIDAFENNATGFASVTFNGGLDDDVLLNNADQLASLVFNGDGGSDVFVNHGAEILGLTFTGGADDDILVNDGTAIVGLTFNGGSDDDLLINSGDLVAILTFNGGADDDIFINSGGQLGDLTFNGEADDDILVNDGPVIASLVFNGDTGNDRLWNRKSGILVDAIVFFGDDGLDVLTNDAAGITTLTFTGGADDDLLRNNGSVESMTFTGGADDDVLVNSGTVTDLTFGGGADDDILLNRGSHVETLTFGGDGGVDTLFNTGPVTTLTFSGGADGDILQNTAAVTSLTFFGEADAPATQDDGADTLINNGAVDTLVFTGGADDDILQNNATVASLTFGGGADDDVLVNNGSVTTLLDFNGDDGFDTLINNASGIAQLVFTGGADGDTMRIHGRELGSVTFYGGTGTDSFTFNGTATSVVTYNAGEGNDFFAMRGIATTVTFDGGPGNDGTLIVGSGTMTLNGGDGDDIVRFVSNPLADVTLTDLYGGSTDTSKDTLDFSSFTGGAVKLDLRLVDDWQSQGNGQLRIWLTDGMSIENIIGSQLADTIYGNPRSNYIGGADFDAAFTGPVAGPRNVTQWVFLDFDTNTNTGVIDSVTGLADAGEHVYSVGERALIRQRIESVYRGPSVGSPWFDVRVVTNLTEIPDANRSSQSFATVFFNKTPDSGRPGGLASEIDPGNVNLGGSAVVQVNGLLGGVITSLEAEAEIEGDLDGLKSDHGSISDIEIGASKPAGTSDNFVRLSSKIAAHELAHLLGLRHQDSFGPIGSGVHDPPGVGGYKPIYTGPAGGVETFDHLIGSPATIGSTRFDDLNDLFFGEREAIKLAFANSNPAQTTVTEGTAVHNSQMTAAELTPVILAVPNTLSRGLNQPKAFFVQLASVNGQIEIDSTTGDSESDWYSFTGRAGELINIDVLSNSVARFAGVDGELNSDEFVDSIVRVWYVVNGTRALVPYYGGFAENDDTFEPTDSSLIDLLLPVAGTYYIEVDTFQRSATDAGYLAATTLQQQLLLRKTDTDSTNNLSAAEEETLARLTDTIDDTDTGRYQLIMYKFRKASSSDGIDTLKGFGGIDVIVGGPGESYVLDYGLGASALTSERSTFTRTVTIFDPGASAWAGSTVNYGDSLEVHPLIVSSTGTFTLNHIYADNGTFTVTVTIVDDIGQSLTRQLDVTVENVAPTPSIDISLTRLEGTFIRFTGSATDPDDAADDLTYLWTFGDGSPGIKGATPEYTYADNGRYDVTLTVSDGDGGSAFTTITITVNNVAPTVSLDGPTSGIGGTEVTILSTVADPAGAADPLSYQWTVTRNGSAFATQTGGTWYAFTPTLIGNYELTLRVDDGDMGITTAVHTLTVTSSSTNTAPTVGISGPATGVRGDSITYTFAATDPDAADQDGLFTWTINWGDDSPVQTVTGPATIAVGHVFTTVAVSRTITAKATDSANNPSEPAVKSVQIVAWELQPDPLQSGSFILVVGGSLGDDGIRVRDRDSRHVSYYELRFDSDDDDTDNDDGDYNGRDDDNDFSVRIYQDITGVVVYAQAGDDRIDFDAALSTWSIINGGAGDDRIKSGGSRNIIIGGEGNDRLDGEQGRDLLIGGRGSDRIDGGNDDDIVIAGFTAFDDNREALLSIMKEWSSSSSFSSRRDHLMGTTSGGLNQDVLLMPSGANRSVFDDNVTDELWGGEGRDWFLLNMNSAEVSRVDKIKDWRSPDEDDDINLF